MVCANYSIKKWWRLWRRRPSVIQMFWWVPVLTAELRYLLHLSAEIRPPGSLLQKKEKEMVNRKGSMISTSKGFQSKWDSLTVCLLLSNCIIITVSTSDNCVR